MKTVSIYSSHVACCVPLCSATKNKCPTLSFHKFPQNEERKKLWIQNIRRDEGPLFKIGQGTKVCSRHFLPTDFKTLNTLGFTALRNKILKPDAVPQRFAWTQWQVPENRNSLIKDKAEYGLEIKDETFSEDIPTSAILRAETVSTLKIHHLKEENEQAIPEIKDSVESQRDEKFSKENYYLKSQPWKPNSIDGSFDETAQKGDASQVTTESSEVIITSQVTTKSSQAIITSQVPASQVTTKSSQAVITSQVTTKSSQAVITSQVTTKSSQAIITPSQFDDSLAWYRKVPSNKRKVLRPESSFDTSIHSLYDPHEASQFEGKGPASTLCTVDVENKHVNTLYTGSGTKENILQAHIESTHIGFASSKSLQSDWNLSIFRKKNQRCHLERSVINKTLVYTSGAGKGGSDFTKVNSLKQFQNLEQFSSSVYKPWKPDSLLNSLVLEPSNRKKKKKTHRGYITSRKKCRFVIEIDKALEDEHFVDV